MYVKRINRVPRCIMCGYTRGGKNADTNGVAMHNGCARPHLLESLEQECSLYIVNGAARWYMYEGMRHTMPTVYDTGEERTSFLHMP